MTQDFDFLGVPCRLHLSAESDFEHCSYYFRDFLATKPREPQLEIRLQVENPEAGFLASFGTELVKEIHYRRPGTAWELYESFTLQSQRPSPLPPFAFEPIKSRFQILHAASLATDSRGILLSGPSFSGKSCLALSLLRGGWSFLSDDMSVLERDSLLLFPYARPVGIRENTRRLMPWLTELVAEKGKRYDFWHGQTAMVRPEELFPGCLSDPKPAEDVYLLANHSAQSEPHLEPIESDHALQELTGASVFTDLEDDHELMARLRQRLRFKRLSYNVECHLEQAVSLISEDS